MSNDALKLLIVAVLISLLGLAQIGTTHYQIMMKILTEAGYEQVVLPGSAQTRWQKAD